MNLKNYIGIKEIKLLMSGGLASGGASVVMTTKGDLAGFDTVRNRIPIGTDAQVLTADSTESLGIKWATSASASYTKSATVSYSETIGDYTTPTGVVSSSDATSGDLTLNVVAYNAGGSGANNPTTYTLKSTGYLKADQSDIFVQTLRATFSTGAMQGSLRYIELRFFDSNNVARGTMSAGGYQSAINSSLTSTPSANVNHWEIWSKGDGMGSSISVSGLNYDAYEPINPALMIDDDTATYWQSLAEVNPNVYVDMGGASVNNLGCAIYLHANTTETEIAIRVSSDVTFTSPENTRTITVSNLTSGAWNYIRWNLSNARYMQIYGNSGSSVVLAISEIKYLTKTDSQVLSDLTVLTISPTDTAIALNGV